MVHLLYIYIYMQVHGIIAIAGGASVIYIYIYMQVHGIIAIAGGASVIYIYAGPWDHSYCLFTEKRDVKDLVWVDK